jgi:hypothetical protein
MAQMPSKVDVRGVVVDSMTGPVSYATIMLLSPIDSTLVNFTRTDERGGFTFRNIKNTGYHLKVSYMGYLPYHTKLTPSENETRVLDTIRIKPINQTLMEVVVRTAKAPLSIRGDTIEYDASTFKVPPGSTVEDLLRRLPGIEVDADGNIKAQGKSIGRLYVDGRTFFSDDPKSATKNLGAEAISKVQVFNEQSEQAKLSGVADGKQEKAMNLELKEAYKKGAFGKLTVGGGSSNRWASRGNYNRFNTKNQFSLIGYANNINQTGVNWEDYSEFKGNTDYGYDNGDFGFSSGVRVFYMGEGGFTNNFDGRGFTENYGGGVNYNNLGEKTTTNASYLYNETTLNLDQFGFRETFLPGASFNNTDTMAKQEYRNNHSLNMRMESKLDSSKTVTIKGNSKWSLGDTRTLQSQLFQRDEVALNALEMDHQSNLRSLTLTTTAIYRQRFKKKGRSFALSSGYNRSIVDGSDQLLNVNRFFSAEDFTEQIRQLNANENNMAQFKASALATEGLSKRWFVDAFYNFMDTRNTVDRQVKNPTSGERIDLLSVYFDNRNLYQRLGSAIRYSNAGLNFALGLAGQQIQIDGQYGIDQQANPTEEPLSRKFRNLTPNIDVSYEFNGSTWINATYAQSATEPKIADLQPVPNVNNPAFRTTGNPALSPELSHSFDVSIHQWNAATFSSFGLSFDLDLYDNRIVYNQSTEFVDSLGLITTATPVNVEGGKRYEGYLWMNFPLVKTKLTASLHGGFSGNQSPILVNGVENQTMGRSVNAGFNLNFTPDDHLQLSVGGDINLNKIRYSLSSEADQDIVSNSLDVVAKWQFLPKTYLETNVDYNVYINNLYAFDQRIPIWNASFRRLLGKSNRYEIRLAAFDLLNRRVSIFQNGNLNYFNQTIAATLARYYMVSVSYNIKGFEEKLKKGYHGY